MNAPLVFTLDRQQWKPPRSKPLRLIKRTFTDPLPPGTRLQLLGRGRQVLDEEIVQPGHTFPLAIGFWIPWPQKNLWLRMMKPDGLHTVHRVDVKGRAAPAMPLTPMADLQKYLTRREAAADVWPGVKRLDVAGYLRRHAIVYEKPATHWTEGLYLGSGQTGGVVTGALGGEFHLGLGDARIWLADAENKPLGPGYAADLRLRYDASGEFRQTLDIGQAIVRTTHGPLSIDCWIDRETSVTYLELTATKAVTVEATLSRQPLPLGGVLPSAVHGSWARIFRKEKLAEFQKQADDAPKAPIDAMVKNGVGSLTVTAPNITVRTAIRADRAVPKAGDATVRLTLRLKKNQKQRLILSVDVAPRNAATQVADAIPRSPNASATSATALKRTFDHHQRAWSKFWNRSFLQLANPLQEALYYHGLYHVAATFAGNVAPGFFGMTQPIDHRTWMDGHVTDAQTQLLQWGTLATNHLASAAPLLASYADAWPEHAEHTPSPGAKVPHMFYPLNAGGHGSLAPPATLPYPFGSTAWHALDFWWDYLYSQDRKFLRDLAYPILRSAADAVVSTMAFRDGVYHCENSNSPEQDNCKLDNVYDRTTVQALLSAVTEASRVLGVDRPERRRFTTVLRQLFPLPTDGRTIFESADNTHPYRCHPVVLMGLYPLMQWWPGSREWQMAQSTFDLVNNVYGFHYEDRHKTIPGHAGGIEPNGHATAFLLAFAARLRRPQEFDRLFNCLVVGRQLKRNGLRSICDPRHSVELERMAIIEASSGQTAAIAETVLQSWGDHIDVFTCAVAGQPQRFAGLRAAGGFVVSGEWTGERVKFIAVQSMAGGKLNLATPWDGPVLTGTGRRVRFPLRTRAGRTYVFATRREDLAVHEWRVAPRDAPGPIAIPVAVTDPHSVDVLYYPEDLPHGQQTGAGHLFLGNPARMPVPAELPWDEREALRQAKSSNVFDRQTAARVLGRAAGAKSRAALARLASDNDVLVAATAAVSLVRHHQPAADRLLKSLDLPPYVRREADKALARRDRT